MLTKDKNEIEDNESINLITTSVFIFMVGIIMLMGFLASTYEYDSYFIQNTTEAFNFLGKSLYDGLVERPYNFSIKYPIIGLLIFVLSFIIFIYIFFYSIIYIKIIKPLFIRFLKKKTIQLEGGKE